MAKKIHYFTGILLILFISGHVLNHTMILVSEELHLQFMATFRKIYRIPVVEVLLYAAVGVQLVTGGRLLWKKWRHTHGIWDKLQVWSGAFFLYFLVMHPLAVIWGRYVWELDTNLYFGAAVLNVKPLVYYFVFHYGLSIWAFFTHLACVHRVKMTRWVSVRSANVQATAMVIAGLVMAVLIVYNMMGMDIPQEYLENY